MQWLQLTIDLPTMNGFIAQWLEFTTDLATMNGFIAQCLELTIDLPTMNMRGFRGGFGETVAPRFLENFTKYL